MANAIFDLALAGLREKGKADAQNLTALSVSGEADASYLIAHENQIPTWRQRAFNAEETPVGKPYKWNGQIYKLWQQHDATNQPDWSPDLAVSLWDICHTKTPNWPRNIWHLRVPVVFGRKKSAVSSVALSGNVCLIIRHTILPICPQVGRTSALCLRYRHD